MAPRSRSSARIAGDGADAPVTQRNSLLGKLPESELDSLLEHGHRFPASLRDMFFEVGDPIDKVYFPLTGMCSLVTVLRDGTSLEAMTVGREGFVGLPLFHGVRTNRTKGMCQIEGEFYEIPASAFVKAMAKAPHLQALLHRYSQYSNEVLTQSAACNSTHHVEQRCARWLLTTSDGVNRKKFNLTQEFLSQMLAVRRAGVTVAIGALERQGLISHRYGAIDIQDIEGLRKAACECYETIRNTARELLS
jgi:CRP-like cAMP-binding protein